jgi:hypothetical protein
MENPSAPEAGAPARKAETLTLSEPIVRGEQKITQLTIRKPKAGEMRGLSMQELMNARVSATLDLLPRITMPQLAQHEVDDMEPEDVAAASGIIIGFFMSNADKRQIERALNR